MNAITPIAETDGTVTLKRDDWEALLDRLEDVADLRAIAAYEADPHRVTFTAAEMVRMVDDDVLPITVLRERIGLSSRALALKAGISVSYLAEIEAGKKPGSVSALRDVAGALGVPMDVVVG